MAEAAQERQAADFLRLSTTTSAQSQRTLTITEEDPQIPLLPYRKPEAPRKTFTQQLKTNLRLIFLTSKLNVLLIFLPIAIALGWYSHDQEDGKLKQTLEGIVFVVSLLALCPLAERLGFVTEELATYTNDTIGGLLNATFGNATEVIICGFALGLARRTGRQEYLRLVQLSLLGSVLSNLLLVLGSAFLVGGIVHPSQNFNREGMTVNSGLLVMAVAAILFPSTLKATGTQRESSTYDYGHSSELNLSRFESVFLLSAYGLYLVFQLCTHRHLFEDDDDAIDTDAESNQEESEENEGTDATGTLDRRTMSAFQCTIQSGEGRVMDPQRISAGSDDDPEYGVSTGITIEDNPLGSLAARPSRRGLRKTSSRTLRTLPEDEVARLLGTPTSCRRSQPEPVQCIDKVQESSELGLAWSIVWLAIIAIFIAILSEFVVQSISAASNKLKIPYPFLSTIILPIVGNAAEHAAAVMFAYRNRMEITLGVAVGSSTQVAVLVIPFCVILGWIMGQPLDLNFQTFEAVALFISVLLAVVAMHDGTSNWLKGILLFATYIFIAAAFWVHDDNELIDPNAPVPDQFFTSLLDKIGH